MNFDFLEELYGFPEMPAGYMLKSLKFAKSNFICTQKIDKLSSADCKM